MNAMHFLQLSLVHKLTTKNAGPGRARAHFFCVMFRTLNFKPSVVWKEAMLACQRALPMETISKKAKVSVLLRVSLPGILLWSGYGVALNID